MSTFFGVVEIASKVCKCGKTPRAVLPLNTPEQGAGIVWLCREHGEQMAAAAWAREENVVTWHLIHTLEKLEKDVP
jgi:hypothetical protein